MRLSRTGHFARRFRKAYGRSPTEFRAAVLSMREAEERVLSSHSHQ
jgi:AraC-like DNA-binding protein